MKVIYDKQTGTLLDATPHKEKGNEPMDEEVFPRVEVDMRTIYDGPVIIETWDNSNYEWVPA